MAQLNKKLLSPLNYYSGNYLAGWRTAAQDSGFTAIICYHRICDETSASSDYAVEAGVPVKVFIKQMEFLKKHFQPVAPKQAGRNSPGELRCVVTFDDGYLDNYTLAAPILEHYGIPAGFYLCSDYVGTERWFWWETVSYLLRTSRKPFLELGSVFPEAVNSGRLAAGYPLHNHKLKEKASAQISGWLSLAPHQAVNPALHSLAAALETDQPTQARPYPLMTWEQAKDLRRRGFEIGAHTANHINLGQLDPQTAAYEIKDSHRKLQELSEGEIPSFAYPYGRKQHLSALAVDTVREIAYQTAFTTQRGIMDGSNDPLLAPRFHLNPKWAFGCAYNTQLAFEATNQTKTHRHGKI